MIGDPLSSSLKLVNATAILSGGLKIGGAWGFSFPPPTKLKFIAIVEGCAQLRFFDDPGLITLECGDVLLLNGATGFTIFSDPDVTPVEISSVFRSGEKTDNILTIGQDIDFYLIGGHIDFNQIGRDILVNALPKQLLIPASNSAAGTITWLLQHLAREMANEKIGSQIASTQLAQLVFVQSLRAYIEQCDMIPVGWLRGLADKHIAPALHLMHDDPAYQWQLEELAHKVGMSRTGFAERFRKTVGVTPLGYLRNWRMRLAEQALRDTNETIATIALSLGYTSESAFSTAFKQVIGTAPRNYRSENKTAPLDLTDWANKMPFPDHVGFAS